MHPIRTIVAIATTTVLLTAISTLFSTVEARNPNSDKQTHYYSPPILLLPYMEQLRICVADAASSGRRVTGQLKLQVMEARVYDLNGGILLETDPKLLAPGESGVCLDIATDKLGPPGGAFPTAIVAELIVSAPAESKSVPIVTFELRDSRNNTSSAVLLPVVQAEAPIAPGRFTNYRPQFYFRTTDVSGTLTHVFGPFTLAAGQAVEICAADATQVPTDPISLNFTKMEWTTEVYDIGGRPLLILAEEVEGESSGVCFEEISLAELALGGPDSTQPKTMNLLILLYAKAPPGSRMVPMATGRLTKAELTDPPLLLPAVQATREAAR